MSAKTWLSIFLLLRICSAALTEPNFSTIPGYSTLPRCAQNGLHYYFSEGGFAQCNTDEDATDYASCLCNAGSSSFDFELSSWRDEFCSTISPGGNAIFHNYCLILEGSLAPVGSSATATVDSGGAISTAASPGSSVTSSIPAATNTNSGQNIGDGDQGTGNGGCSGISGSGNTCTIQAGNSSATRKTLSCFLVGVWLALILMQILR